MNIINEVPAVSLAMADMELSEWIQQLQQLDEMKNDTAITRRIKDVLRILSKDATKMTNLERLLENIRRSYRGMLHDVEEKKIKHLETGQAVQAISQIYNWWGAFSCVHCAREN